jgi:hypothetical protein
MDDYFFGSVGDLCEISDFDTISSSILYGAVGLIAFFEFYKLYTDHQSYFSEGNVGILWWGLCILWCGTMIPVFGPSPLYYHYPIAAVCILNLLFRNARSMNIINFSNPIADKFNILLVNGSGPTWSNALVCNSCWSAGESDKRFLKTIGHF